MDKRYETALETAKEWAEDILRLENGLPPHIFAHSLDPADPVIVFPVQVGPRTAAEIEAAKEIMKTRDVEFYLFVSELKYVSVRIEGATEVPRSVSEFREKYRDAIKSETKKNALLLLLGTKDSGAGYFWDVKRDDEGNFLGLETPVFEGGEYKNGAAVLRDVPPMARLLWGNPNETRILH